MVDTPNIMNEDIMFIDRDFLLIGLTGILNIEIDWEDNLVITDKKAYNTNEFLIKMLASGRKVLYKNQVGEILQCFKAYIAIQNKQLIKNNRKVRVNNVNALNELYNKLERIDKTTDDIDYFRIYRENLGEDYEYIKIIDVNDSIDKLNFKYDNDFGKQELFGYVVFKDKTWLERDEYDGREWWEYKCCPTKEKINE